MNKNLIILVGIFLILPIFVSAGIPHSVYGFLPSSDGTTITAYVESRPSEILTDNIGIGGNSKVNEGWLIDIGNFNTPWKIGDILIIEFPNKNINLILNDAGAQEVKYTSSTKASITTITNDSDKESISNINPIVGNKTITEPKKTLQQKTINSSNKTELNSTLSENENNNKTKNFIKWGIFLFLIIIVVGVIFIRKFRK
ncbi:MAG: hypothetical protein WC413_01595 [Candidatus Nanoarchaeia archaeon]